MAGFKPGLSHLALSGPGSVDFTGSCPAFHNPMGTLARASDSVLGKGATSGRGRDSLDEHSQGLLLCSRLALILGGFSNQRCRLWFSYGLASVNAGWRPGPIVSPWDSRACEERMSAGLAGLRVAVSFGRIGIEDGSTGDVDPINHRGFPGPMSGYYRGPCIAPVDFAGQPAR
jgi:hypothetical protein